MPAAAAGHRSRRLIVYALCALPLAAAAFSGRDIFQVFLVSYYGLFMFVFWGFEWEAVVYACVAASAGDMLAGYPLSMATGVTTLEMLLFAKACFFLSRRTGTFVGIAPLSYIFSQFVSCLLLGILAQISPSETGVAFFSCLLRSFPGSLVLLLLNLVATVTETQVPGSRVPVETRDYFPVN